MDVWEPIQHRGSPYAMVFDPFRVFPSALNLHLRLGLLQLIEFLNDEILDAME